LNFTYGYVKRRNPESVSWTWRTWRNHSDWCFE